MIYLLSRFDSALDDRRDRGVRSLRPGADLRLHALEKKYDLQIVVTLRLPQKLIPSMIERRAGLKYSAFL